MMLRFGALIFGVIAWASVAMGQEAPVKMQVGADAQEDLMVTVYNNNYGLIREVRAIRLPEGTIELEFSDVAAQIDPTSVAFKSLTSPNSVGILEQNYRYDLLSPQTILNKYVGKEVTYSTMIMRDNTQVKVDRTGILLSNNEAPIVQFGDEIVISPPGTITLREVPADLLSKPTLLWLLRSDGAGEQNVETAYLTNGMNWRADYVAVIDAKDANVDLTGWVTLENHSGTTYRNAKLKLVAGDVQRVQDDVRKYAMAARAAVAEAAAPQFQEQAFFEYHLYTLQRRATIANNETKQMTLLEGSGVPVKKMYILDSPPWVMQASEQGVETRKLSVMVEFENKEENDLGIPLPQGRVRVYKADADGSQQLIGEDTIEHTPRDEKVRLKLGEAFDVVAERSQTNYSQISRRVSELSYRVAVRNHKEEPITATLLEHVYGDWEITQQSHPHLKRDATTIEFNVPVPSRGETVVTYTARVRW